MTADVGTLRRAIEHERAAADAALAQDRRADARCHLDAAMALTCDVAGADPASSERAALSSLLATWAGLPVAPPGDSLAGATRALALAGGSLDPVLRSGAEHLLVLAKTLRGEASTADLLAAAHELVHASAGRDVAAVYAHGYLASHLEWLGDVDGARTHSVVAAELLDALPSLDTRVITDARRFILQTLAHIDHRRQAYDDAAGHYLAVAELYDLPPERLAMQATAVTSLIAGGQLVRARRLMDNVLDQLEQSEQYRRAILGILGELLTAEGRHEEALAILREVDADPPAPSEPDVGWQLAHARGRNLLALGRLDEALTELRHAVDEALVTRRASLGYALDSSSLAEKRPLFDEAIELAAELGRPEECLRLAEVVKSHWLSKLLSLPATELPAGPRRELVRLAEQVDQLEHAIVAAPSEDVSVLQRQRDQVWSRRQVLLDDLRRIDRRWAALSEGAPIDVGLLVTTMQRRQQAAIELFATERRIITVVVDADGLDVGGVDPPAAVTQALDRYADNLAAARPVSGYLDPARVGIDAAELIPPVLLDRALRAASVVVAPHGQLHLLPWPCVPFRGRRLVMSLPIGVLPNLACLHTLEPPATPAASVVVIGASGADASKGMQAEVTNLRRLYGPSATERPDVQASVLEALAEPGGPTVHLATHGRLDASWPMASGILCRDGWLDAAEVVVHGVTSREVVLSACSTGWRPYQIGDTPLYADDVVGLPGAFLEAGASSVVVSISPTEDAAMRRLMVDFHAARHRGEPPLHALATAQRRRLELGEPAWAWCGTVVYGAA